MKRTVITLLAGVLFTSACMVQTSSGRRGSGPPPPPPREHRGEHRPPPGPGPGPAPVRAIYVEGRVTDGSTGQPIGRAAIDYTGPAVGTATTDADGYFRTPDLPPGEYTVRVRREHFETMIKPAHVIDGPQRVDIVLKKK